MKGSRIFRRHQESLFADVLLDEDEEKVLGRDPELIAARNLQIMYRYHYFCAYTDKRWEAVIPILSREFFLSEVTMSKIIQKCSVLRKQIINEKPSVREIKKRFEMDWTELPVVVKRKY